MQSIDCAQCGTTVLVEKYSAEHTSVQWIEDAFESCPRLRRGEQDAPDTHQSQPIGPLCPALHATIDQAASDGRIRYSLRTEPTRGVLR